VGTPSPTEARELPGESGGWPKGFNQNGLGNLLANREAGVADLANEIGLAGEQLNDLILTKAQLSQTILDFRGGAELLDPDGHPGLDHAERTHLTSGLRFGCAHPVHIHGIILVAAIDSHYTLFVVWYA
jgi:hypothetical protein